MITYDMFYHLFQLALSRTLELVQEEVSNTLPKEVLMELAGFGQDSHESSLNEILFYFYIDGTVPRIVDIGVKGIVANKTIVWIRPSGHAYTNDLNKTWNNPPGAGPFKSIGLIYLLIFIIDLDLFLVKILRKQPHVGHTPLKPVSVTNFYRNLDYH